MKVHLTSTGIVGRHRDNPESVQGLAERLAAYNSSEFAVVGNPDDADIILFIEPNNYRPFPYRKLLQSQKLVAQYPNRCFAYDYSDCPVGFLPGVYVGIPKHRNNRCRYRAGGYLTTPYNPAVEELAADRDRAPQLLASFRGSASHPIRSRLFAADCLSKSIAITQTYAWFSHSASEKRVYVEEMLDSLFVLCPRGVAPSSIRLFETMQLGRVPVIISDDWIEPDGPDWQSFSIRLPEKSITDIPSILAMHEPNAAKMGSEARTAWEQWFSPDVQIGRVVENVRSIIQERAEGVDEKREQQKWSSLAFNARMGLDYAVRSAAALPDRLKRKLRPSTTMRQV